MNVCYVIDHLGVPLASNLLLFRAAGRLGLPVSSSLSKVSGGCVTLGALLQLGTPLQAISSGYNWLTGHLKVEIFPSLKGLRITAPLTWSSFPHISVST